MSADGFDTGFDAGTLGSEMRRAADEMAGAERATRALASSVGSGLRRAMDEAVSGSARLGDVLRGLAADTARGALRAAAEPLGQAVARGVGGLVSRAAGALAGGVAGAAGNVRGNVRAFARGGVVDGATHFPLAGGTGLMGEAGPEAIIPLARGADGRLGVRGGGGVSVTLNVATPDVGGFQRSGPQIAAALARMVDRGRRSL